MHNVQKDYVTTESGLQYKDLREGSGPSPRVGFQVAADYVAQLPDGKVFDSSLEKGVPYIFRVGSGQVISGLDEGILTMKAGGTRRLYIPGPLAFPKGLSAAAGRPRVPPSSPVVFDVSLLYIPGLSEREEDEREEVASAASAESAAKDDGCGRAAAPRPSSGWQQADDRASDDLLTVAFGELVRRLWVAPPPSLALRPSQLVASVQRHIPQFAGFRQHDSQEFLRALVSRLDEECAAASEAPGCPEPGGGDDGLAALPEAAQAGLHWERHRQRSASAIQDIFCGQLQSTVECGTCGRRSHCFDPFLDLSIPIPRHGGIGAAIKRLSVTDCLDAFVAEERLDEDNAYLCSMCKSRQPATKRLSIFRPPRILVLHVKRISPVGVHSLRKDSSLVHFDLDGLDCRPFMSCSSPAKASCPQYDLFAVINHVGSLSSGHYTASCRNADDGMWYAYNDSKVATVLPGSICSPAAYVLFYQMRLQ
eukprot:SM000147S01126  [mRNA]  locus=s147:223501:229987:+ [translate_table: standard]